MCDTARRGLAVGFFDGVHRGHQAVLSKAAAALTFRNHPLNVLDPSRAPRLLMPFESRLAAIRACGVTEVTALEFTPELARTSAEDFLHTALSRAYELGGVFCGGNWRFGRNGEGDANFLRSRGVETLVVPFAEYRSKPVSSTRIRAAIENADMIAASAMLGRPWCVSGTPARGKGLGSKIGFPTLNLQLKTLQLNLQRGVYAVEVLGRRAIANYGVAPTVLDAAWKEPVLEVHFMGGEYTNDGTARDIEVSFLRFIRPERRFPSLNELERQIRADIASAAKF